MHCIELSPLGSIAHPRGSLQSITFPSLLLLIPCVVPRIFAIATPLCPGCRATTAGRDSAGICLNNIAVSLNHRGKELWVEGCTQFGSIRSRVPRHFKNPPSYDSFLLSQSWLILTTHTLKVATVACSRTNLSHFSWTTLDGCGRPMFVLSSLYLYECIR